MNKIIFKKYNRRSENTKYEKNKRNKRKTASRERRNITVVLTPADFPGRVPGYFHRRPCLQQIMFVYVFISLSNLAIFVVFMLCSLWLILFFNSVFLWFFFFFSSSFIGSLFWELYLFVYFIACFFVNNRFLIYYLLQFLLKSCRCY